MNSPSGQNFSPTVTPCNSPDEGNSPTRCRSPEPGSSVKNKNAFQNLEKKALRSLNLLEQVNNLGLESIVTPSTSKLSAISPLALYSSNIYTSRSSPMAQLTSFRNFTEKRTFDENLTQGHTMSDRTKKHSERKTNRLNRPKMRHRQDLGKVRPDLGKIEKPKIEEKSLVEEFVGSISSMLFGRKGGLL